MKTPATKPIQIFRPGRHVAMSGAALDFSESDLQASAAAYDPAKHEAPIVVGHPKADAPAYGWVRKLAFSEGGLEADPHQVNADFAELVAKGSFKKVSASFYAPESPQNPVPGVYYLRHVGFLGAQPPAVKGLRSPEFAEAEEGVVEFADWSDVQNASLWRRMREWIISFRGLDEADKVIPDYAVATLEDEARKESADETDPASFSDPSNNKQETHVTPEQAAALEAENLRLKNQLTEFSEREKTAKATAIHSENAAFVETLIVAGKLLPAQKAFVVSFMDHVSANAGVIEFGEGDQKKSLPGIDGFKAYLESQPKIVDFSERAGDDKGQVFDVEDPMAINKRAVEFQEAEAKAGRTVDIATAVAEVMKKT